MWQKRCKCNKENNETVTRKMKQNIKKVTEESCDMKVTEDKFGMK